MQEKNIIKIIRKTILENFGSSQFPLSSVVFKKDEYEIPGDFFEDYFKAVVAELNKTDFAEISDNMQIPSNFSDSEGSEYNMINLEKTSEDIYAYYSTMVDDIEFTVKISFTYSLNIYDNGSIKLSVSNGDFDSLDYDRRLKPYMDGDVPRDAVMNN